MEQLWWTSFLVWITAWRNHDKSLSSPWRIVFKSHWSSAFSPLHLILQSKRSTQHCGSESPHCSQGQSPGTKLTGLSSIARRHLQTPTRSQLPQLRWPKMLIQKVYCIAVPSKNRKTIKWKHPLPDTQFTKAPRMDPTIQSRMTPAAKAVDRNLAHL